MTSEAATLAAKLQGEGDRLAAFFSVLRRDQWSAEVYTEASIWTIRNILVHLVSSERAFVTLFEQIRKGGQGVSEDFVIDRYNAGQQRKATGVGPHELLEQFRAARAEMVSLVRDLEDIDLERRGRHPYLGVTSLREMVKMIYIHNEIHYRDARRALKD